MKKLLADPEAYFAAAERPSQHQIAYTFRDNGGALPSHLLSIPNSESNGTYLRACKAAGVAAHPARFPEGLPEFFVKLLTDPGDLVIDFFAGSNTTGAVAERLGRRWQSCELDQGYVAASAFRFVDQADRGPKLYRRIMAGKPVEIDPVRQPASSRQPALGAAGAP